MQHEHSLVDNSTGSVWPSSLQLTCSTYTTHCHGDFDQCCLQRGDVLLETQGSFRRGGGVHTVQQNPIVTDDRMN